MPEIVKIRTADQQITEVPRMVAIQSLVIRAVVEDYGLDDDVYFEDLTKPIMEKAMEFCHHLVESDKAPKLPKPLRGDSLKDCGDWYFNFINELDEDTVIELVLAGNILNVVPLFELASAKVALMLKDKNAAELRTFFKVENDWTPAVVERIKKENKWCEESI